MNAVSAGVSGCASCQAYHVHTLTYSRGGGWKACKVCMSGGRRCPLAVAQVSRT